MVAAAMLRSNESWQTSPVWSPRRRIYKEKLGDWNTTSIIAILSCVLWSFFIKHLVRNVSFTLSKKMSSHTVSSPQGVDPSAPGNIIRVALAFESLAIVGVGAYYMFFPRHYLLHTMGAAAAQVTTTALQAAQQFGAVNVFIGATVGLFIPNTKKAVGSRQILYSGLLAFELFYMPLLVWQAFTMEGGMLRESLLAGAMQFVPFVVWRIFTLGWKPEWFGRYLEEGRKRE